MRDPKLLLALEEEASEGGEGGKGGEGGRRWSAWPGKLRACFEISTGQVHVFADGPESKIVVGLYKSGSMKVGGFPSVFLCTRKRVTHRKKDTQGKGASLKVAK